MNRQNRKDNPLLAAALVGALGIQVAVFICLGYWIGSSLDSRLGSEKNWTIGGILIGLVIGLVSAILIVKRVMEDSDG